jgi:hypothetical protein
VADLEAAVPAGEREALIEALRSIADLGSQDGPAARSSKT